MKNITITFKYIGICLSLLFIASCNDDFVSTRPLGEVSEEVTWSDAALAEAFVLDIYNGLGQGGLDEQMQASLTDEAMFTHPGRGINTVTESRSNAADRGWINGTYSWSELYKRIRATNIAIKNLAEPKFNDSNKANRLLGEAHFLRAYYYQQLLRLYESIHLVDMPYELGETDYTLERSTYEDCVNFIVSDSDKAVELLNIIANSEGREKCIAVL